MLVIESIRETKQMPDLAALPGLVMTIGSFDGVHRGHRRILDDVLRKARDIQGTAAVLTLQPHPRQLFAPGHAPNLLTTYSAKLKLFAAAGMEVAFVLRFDEAAAHLSPEAFVEEILVRRCGACHVVVGHDFQFGQGAQGDYDLLCALGDRFGFSVSQTPPLLLDGERVSSTLIRERILEGDLAEAERLLGRKYSIVGEVVRGRRIGAALGFPTANVMLGACVAPPHGVYAAEVVLADASHAAAVNIGIAPTIRHEDVVIEAHILDFAGELEGRELEIVFHERLRPERKFPSREALMAQIAEDVEHVRERMCRP